MNLIHVIAILAEFDALPGLNQAATPFRSVTQEVVLVMPADITCSARRRRPPR